MFTKRAPPATRAGCCQPIVQNSPSFSIQEAVMTVRIVMRGGVDIRPSCLIGLVESCGAQWCEPHRKAVTDAVAVGTGSPSMRLSVDIARDVTDVLSRLQIGRSVTTRGVIQQLLHNRAQQGATGRDSERSARISEQAQPSPHSRPSTAERALRRTHGCPAQVRRLRCARGRDEAAA